MKKSFAIVGCGRLGTNLALQLVKAGYPVAGLSSKNLVSAKNLGKLIGTTQLSDKTWEITPKADIVFIATPDDMIQKMCEQIAEKKAFKKGSVVLHCSGSLSSAVLDSAKKAGALTASMHPLQSFADKSCKKNPFEGVFISTEGEKEATKTAEQIVSDLGGKNMSIYTEGKSLYHAAAVVASNYLVTLLYLAQELNKAAGISAKDSMESLKPLIHGTLQNIENQGIPAALTGPIARGDVETVARHIKEMEAKTPELTLLYKALGAYTVKLASAKETITEEKAQALRELLQIKL